jgi:hypothetical protein
MDSKYKKEVLNDTKADIWRRHINQFSIGMLIAVAVLFLLQIVSERSNEFYAQTRFEESLRPIVVEEINNENSVSLDASASMAEVETTGEENTANISNPQFTAESTSNILVGTSIPRPTDITEPTSHTTSEASVDSQPTIAPTVSTIVASPVGNQTYYVIISANLRPCPYVTNDCAVTESLSKGTSLAVTGEVNGDTFQSSTLWYSLERNRQTVYVHSSLVSTTPPAP